MSSHPRTSLIQHVSEAGVELIEILVHGAMNLPINSQNQLPKAYVTRYFVKRLNKYLYNYIHLI